MLVGGLLIESFGWRRLFLTVGAASLLWLIPWLAGPRDSEPSYTFGNSVPEPRRKWSRSDKRNLMATSIGMFFYGFTWYFLVTWIPSYLARQHGLSGRELAAAGSAPFFVMAVCSLIGGVCSDRAIRRGRSVTLVRKLLCGGGMVLCGVVVAGLCLNVERRAAVTLLILASAFLGLCSSNIWAITQTLARHSAVATWTGIQNLVGNLGGVVSPWLTGYLVGRESGFAMSFGVAALACIVGGLIFIYAVGPIESPEGCHS